MPAQPEALTIHGAAHASTSSIEADFWAELAQIHWLDGLWGAWLHDDNAVEMLVETFAANATPSRIWPL